VFVLRVLVREEEETKQEEEEEEEYALVSIAWRASHRRKANYFARELEYIPLVIVNIYIYID
jgi:hypothetical protein